MSDSTASSNAPMTVASFKAATPLAALTLMVGCLAFHVFAPLGPDVSWLLTVAERMLDGRVLYVDILEPNPPMAGILYILPVWLARILGVAAEPIVVVFTLGFGLATALLATGVIRAARLASRVDLFFLLTVLLAVIAWGEDFAQREHFAAMAAVPAIVAIAARAAGRPLPRALWLPVGLCGGLLLAIKPHFALAMLVPLTYAIWKRRSLAPLLAPELWVAGTIMVGFLTMTWIWFPGFFSTILPAANTVYVPDRRSLPVLLLGVPAALLFEITLAMAVVIFWRVVMSKPLHAALFFASLGFALVYLAQGKGFPYHIAPGQVMLSLAMLGALIERGEAQRSRSDLVLALVAAAALATPAMGNAIRVRQVWEGQAQVLRPYGEGLRIANLTTDLALTSPLHRIVRGELINSAPSLLMMLSAHRVRNGHDPDETWSAAIAAVEEADLARVKSDILRHPPDVIVISPLSIALFDWARNDAELGPMIATYREIAEVAFVGGPVRLLGRSGLEARVPN